MDRSRSEDGRFREGLRKLYSSPAGTYELARWLESGRMFDEVGGSDPAAVEHDMVVRFVRHLGVLGEAAGERDAFYERLAEWLLEQAGDAGDE